MAITTMAVRAGGTDPTICRPRAGVTATSTAFGDHHFISTAILSFAIVTICGIGMIALITVTGEIMTSIGGATSAAALMMFDATNRAMIGVAAARDGVVKDIGAIAAIGTLKITTVHRTMA